MTQLRHSWVAEAAARAEERSRIQTHQTPIKALDQLQMLIGAIMNPRVKRSELERLAKSMSEGKK